MQRALDEHPSIGPAGIRVTERDGVLELRGRVPDRPARATASAVARGVPGVGPVRNLLGTIPEPEVFAVGYGYPWLHTLLERATRLDFDDVQIARIEDIAEHKLVDLFDVAEEAALANGRSRVIRQDLPLTKGLQLVLLEVADIAREFELEPLLIFLADAGIRTPFDEGLRSEIPPLMAAMLIVTARLVAMLGLDRAAEILDLTL